MIEKVNDWRHCPVCDRRVENLDDFVKGENVLVHRDGWIKRMMKCDECNTHWWVVYKPTAAYRHIFGRNEND
jgi:hypothetical protein